MYCNTPGFPILHYLLEFAQTHAHWVSDSIQTSHPLSPPSPLPQSSASGSFPVSWLFTSGIQSIGAWTVHSFQRILRIDFLLDWLVWSPCHARDCLESSPEQFKSISSSVLSLLYGPNVTTLHDYWENHSFDYMDVCWQSNVSIFNILSRIVITFLLKASSF